MYTSYFGNIDNLPIDLCLVSIAGKAPNACWFDLEYKKLAPKYDFFMKWKENHDNEYYIKCFNEQVLSKLDPREVLNDIIFYTNARPDKICLLCYEKPEDFCHRHLVANWFLSHGIHCEEYR